MSDRLSALDASLLYVEETATPMHIGWVAIFRRPRSGFDYDQLVDLIEQRIALVPRYRQKVRSVPGHLARPVWTDDQDFDITHHVRLSALPKPGTEDQLATLVGRLMARPLDPNRPRWELYLVEGLQRNRFALITKTHHAMVDGVGAMEIGQVILDDTPNPPPTEPGLWMPMPEPGGFQLLTDAVAETIRRPGELVDNLRAAVDDLAATGRKIVNTVTGVASVVSSAAVPAPSSPLNVRTRGERRFAMARAKLIDLKKVRMAYGSSVNDVVLAVVAGALRSWLMSRGEAVSSRTTIRAMAPVSVRDAATTNGVGSGVGSDVTAYLLELPVGESNPVVRLHQVSHAMRGHAESGRTVAAETLVRLGGFAPPTLHALGARAASAFSQRFFNIVVQNVPGPQVPLYASGAKMVEMFPVVPLARNQAVSIGVTSYHGGVYFGLNADRDAMPDVDILARMVEESVEELLGTVGE
ncbi:MAG TPA: wax ester/triacylglycerol synthase family O-acyltransferase [Pseudonocardiaceae bacterium]|jgi:WS/DGAT/MGAT family acyltransferase|nr:wax ester/triacylglycerol synthase family O-acyltransferase [Pseudonocardiaceae bacterium]